MKIETHIKQLIGNEDEFIVGFANLSGLLPQKYAGHNYAVVIGKKLDDSIIDSISTGPNMDYFNLYHNTNRALAEVIRNVSQELNRLNISTILIEPTSSDEELDNEFSKTLRLDFSHKMAATRAGLGWIGKTDLFISHRFGPRLRLASILTDHPMESEAAPVDESRCGNCVLCVKQCPAQAANGKLWSIDVDRDMFYNPFKCREKCFELSWQNMRKKISICGICVSVCPIGKKDSNQNTTGQRRS
jgi:epoxyqueuosine reductase QueG